MTATLTPDADRGAARDRGRRPAALRRRRRPLPGSGRVDVVSPMTGEPVATVPFASAADVEAAVARAARGVPGVAVGARARARRLVKRFGELLTEHKADLADLVSVEVGKIALRGAGRGPGDDRHLRLRGRAVAPARRAGRCRRSARATG